MNSVEQDRNSNCLQSLRVVGSGAELLFGLSYVFKDEGLSVPWLLGFVDGRFLIVTPEFIDSDLSVSSGIVSCDSLSSIFSPNVGSEETSVNPTNG